MACRTNRICACSPCNSCGCSPCGCTSSCCTDNNYYNVKEVAYSYPIKGGLYRAVKYTNGCCDVLAKGYVPGNFNYEADNGPSPHYDGYGQSSNSESEGMDCMNYAFNRVNPASP